MNQDISGILAMIVWYTTKFLDLSWFLCERYYVPLTSAVNNGEESQERRCTCECAPYFFSLSWPLPQSCVLLSFIKFVEYINMGVLLSIFLVDRWRKLDKINTRFLSIKLIKFDFVLFLRKSLKKIEKRIVFIQVLMQNSIDF